MAVIITPQRAGVSVDFAARALANSPPLERAGAARGRAALVRRPDPMTRR